jgi:hypothetical protein
MEMLPAGIVVSHRAAREARIRSFVIAVRPLALHRFIFVSHAGPATERFVDLVARERLGEARQRGEEVACQLAGTGAGSAAKGVSSVGGDGAGAGSREAKGSRLSAACVVRSVCVSWQEASQHKLRGFRQSSSWRPFYRTS